MLRTNFGLNKKDLEEFKQIIMMDSWNTLSLSEWPNLKAVDLSKKLEI